MKKGEFWVVLFIGFTILVVLFGMFGLEVIEHGFSINILLLFLFFEIPGILVILHAGKFLGCGHPRYYLPAGKIFQKISEFRGKNNLVFLALKHAEDYINYDDKIEDYIKYDMIRLYRIRADILLDEKGNKIKEIPEKFSVKIGQRIILGQELKKHPNLEKVYFIRPN